MRVLSLTLGGTGAPIRELARVDVTTDPVLGCRTERVMTDRHAPLASPPGPFDGERLRQAIWSPHAPDILVAASPEATCATPAGMTQVLPWILVLSAWYRLVALAPSNLLDLCWHRGGGSFSDTPWKVSGTAETSAALLARMLVVMLHQAPPDELVAYAREKR